MANKIEKLTPEQESYLPVFRDMWLKIGLDCTPVDPVAAEAAITELYQWGELKVPKFYHLSSPMACELYLNLVTNQAFMDDLVELVGNFFRGKIDLKGVKWTPNQDMRQPSWWQFLDSDGENDGNYYAWGAWNSVVDAIIRTVVEEVMEDINKDGKDTVSGDALLSMLYFDGRDMSPFASYATLSGEVSLVFKLRQEAMGLVRKHIKNTKLKYMGTWFNGNQDSYWVAFYLFGEYIGAEYQPKTRAGLAAWEKICKSCHWFYPFKDFCLVSDKPDWIHRDDQGRLHDLGMMSLRYRDGWGVYAVHGIRVEGRIITDPETITVKEIGEESNAELRRIKIDLYGHDRFLKDGNAKIRHQDKYGILWEREIPGDETLVMIEMENSTPEPDGSIKHYFQRVPPDTRTAKKAVAWANWFENENDYDPKIET